uniref:DUF6796 family protein n=1 Tax=Roseburia sp. TaxID=2049040 RepID=UPI003FF10AFC
MNTYVAFGILGIISNFAAAWADVPLVKPGKTNPNEGLSLNDVNLWWADVTSKRFKVSFWLSFLGQPGSYITMWLLADLISQGNEALALALKINTFIGCYTGLLCHVVFCMKPLLYQKLHKKMSDNESLEVIKSINPVVNAPMIIGFLALWLGATIIVAIAILTGALVVPKWCLLLNPVVSLLVLMPLKKCGVKIIGALGVGYMLFSVLLIIAGI